MTDQNATATTEEKTVVPATPYDRAIAVARDNGEDVTASPEDVAAIVTRGATLLRDNRADLRVFGKLSTEMAHVAMDIALACRTKTGHPDWKRSGKAGQQLQNAVYSQAWEGVPEDERPSSDDLDSFDASMRQQLTRKVRPLRVVDYVVHTVNGAEKLDRASDAFKELVWQEFSAADLTAPRDWTPKNRKKDEKTNGPGKKGTSKDVFDAAKSGVEALWDAEAKTGVTPIFHVVPIVLGVVDLAERFSEDGTIEQRPSVIKGMAAINQIAPLILRKLEAPKDWSDEDQAVLTAAIDQGRAYIKSASKMKVSK